MQRKEVYATSGTRIALRFFGGFNNMRSAEINQSSARGRRVGRTDGRAYASRENRQTPIFVWAMRDPSATALDKVQMVKSWVEGDTTRELVFDIACAEGQCPMPKVDAPLCGPILIWSVVRPKRVGARMS